MDSVIQLIAESYTTNDYGVQVKTETQTEVFARVGSITRAEFFQAGRNGLNPELRFDVFAGDYNGERVIEYDGQRYAVYRVARKYEPTAYGANIANRQRDDSDYLELYVQRKGGTNGEANNP